MRLISESTTMERFIQETQNSGKDMIHINTIKRILSDIDTAYDVKKVVAELEKTRKEVTRWDSDKHYIYKEGVDWMGEKAVGIVKAELN